VTSRSPWRAASTSRQTISVGPERRLAQRLSGRHPRAYATIGADTRVFLSRAGPDPAYTARPGA
jgi:hypothetical protein